MKSTTKQQTQPEQRILISQDEKGIAYLTNTANGNAATLNNLLRLDNLMDNEDFILSNAGPVRASAYTMIKFFDRYPAAKEQSKYSKVDFVLPDDLAAIKSVLDNVTVRHFEMVTFQDGGWQVDKDDLQQRIDASYRTFAKTPDQLERYCAAKKTADFLNTLPLDDFSRKGFVSDMIVQEVVNGRLEFIPSKKFVFADHLDRQKTAA